MFRPRTDLAMEAKEIFNRSTGSASALEGVVASDYEICGCSVSKVKIMNAKGEKALGKPTGTYTTITVPAHEIPTPHSGAAAALSHELRDMLPQGNGTILVAALGNPNITPDAIGPLAAEGIFATRHLVHDIPAAFGRLRPVAVISTDVLGSTGIESAEIIAAACGSVSPDAVIIVDALAAAELSRVCCTVQISDSGIVPGSGVGNNRRAVNRETLGVPVIAVGVPTVVDAASLAAQLAGRAGYSNVSSDNIRRSTEPMIVTPREIDKQVRQLARTVSHGINAALHPSLDAAEIAAAMS